MRAVAQRVASASVTVGGEMVGSIDHGLLVLLGVARGDTEADAAALAAKLVGLRVFADDQAKMNRSVADVGGAVLVVSQFTLLASVAKGRRPSFTDAADPDEAERLVREFMNEIAAAGVVVAGGRFGAYMQVDLRNDGPVTLVLEAVNGQVR